MSKSPSLRRIQADIRELSIDPSDQYHAAPLESDMFVWHFTIRGAPDTDFEGGIYHGKILLSSEYPFKPPDIMFLTPNGRFETNTKLCLSFSAYHPELWQPAWGIRLILEALISFLPTKGDGAIGALDWTSEERKRLAKKSWEYNSPVYGNCKEFMDTWSKRVKETSASGVGGGEKKKSRFQKEIEQLHALQAAAEGPDKKKKEDGNDKVENEQDARDTEEKKEEVTASDTSQKNELDEITTLQSDDEEEISSKEIIEKNAKEAAVGDTTNSTNDNNISINEPELVDDSKSNDIVEDNKQDENESNKDQVNEAEEESMNTGNSEAVPIITVAENPPQLEAIPESPLLSDPVVHTGIIIFSVIVYLLVRKLQVVVSDLRELDALFHAS